MSTTDKIKAAFISLLLIASITGLKFILYYISGSIAVLSEAWHSFTDISTTAIVFFSILRQHYKNKSSAVEVPTQEKDKGRKVFVKSFLDWFGKVDTELKVAGIISLVLLTVSVLILWRAVFTASVTIDRPLVTGILFVLLSFGSFFLYRFQDTIGREGNSAALRADSLHNRADMAISLLTGASLILYHFGWNIDRWVSVYIALFIFSFAIEMFVNVVVSMAKGGRHGLITDYRFTDICHKIISPATYTRIIERIIGQFSLSRKNQTLLYKFPAYIQRFRRWTAVTLLILLCLGCLKTMAYTVNFDERAFVLRFGQILGPDRMIGPGLHWKLPWPVERVERFQTGKIFSLAVGNVVDFDDPMIWRNDHGDTKTFISGDNNLFLPYLTIHYRIRDPKNYYLNYRSGSADRLIEYQAYHILSQLFAQKAYFDIALIERRQWTSKAEKLLQKKIDEMNAGIEIVAFCLRDLHPPKDISASYENVVAAYQNREQIIHQAQRYYGTTLPQARSSADKAVNEAQAEATSRLKSAQGEAQNFMLRKKGFNAGGDILKHLLALEAAQKNLTGKKLFLIDPKSGIDARMIYFENHIAQEQKN